MENIQLVQTGDVLEELNEISPDNKTRLQELLGQAETGGSATERARVDVEPEAKRRRVAFAVDT